MLRRAFFALTIVALATLVVAQPAAAQQTASSHLTGYLQYNAGTYWLKASTPCGGYIKHRLYCTGNNGFHGWVGYQIRVYGHWGYTPGGWRAFNVASYRGW